MQDIGAILARTSEEEQCSALNALLILLEEKEKEDVCVLQSESGQ